MSLFIITRVAERNYKKMMSEIDAYITATHTGIVVQATLLADVIQKAIFIPEAKESTYTPKSYPRFIEFVKLWASTSDWKRFDTVPTSENIKWGNSKQRFDNVRLPYRHRNPDPDLLILKSIVDPDLNKQFLFTNFQKNNYGTLYTDPYHDSGVKEQFGMVMHSLSCVMVVSFYNNVLYVEVFSMSTTGYPTTLYPSHESPITVRTLSFRSMSYTNHTTIMENFNNVVYKINKQYTITDMIDVHNNNTSIVPDILHADSTLLDALNSLRQHTSSTDLLAVDHQVVSDQKTTLVVTPVTPVVAPVVTSVVTSVVAPVVIPDVIPVVAPDVISTPIDNHFMRDMMLQCLDDMCHIEHYMVDAEIGDTIQITLPEDIHYTDTHAEYTDGNSLVYFRTLSSQLNGIITTSCIIVSANMIHDATHGDREHSLIVNVLKGIFVIASEMYARSQVIMIVKPILFDQIAAITPSMTDIAHMPYRAITFVYNIRAWDIIKITTIGCTTPLLANGIRISYNRIVGDGTIPDSN